MVNHSRECSSCTLGFNLQACCRSASTMYCWPAATSGSSSHQDCHSGNSNEWRGSTRVGKGKVCLRANWPVRPELIPVSVAWSDQEYFFSLLYGMQSYPQHYVRRYLLIHLGGERCYESKVPRNLHNVPGQGSARSGDQRTNHEAIIIFYPTSASGIIAKCSQLEISVH